MRLPKEVPENTSYRYNAKYLNDLSEIIDIKENYTDRLNDAIKSLGNLFLKEK